MKFQQNGIQVAIQPLPTLKIYSFLKAINQSNEESTTPLNDTDETSIRSQKPLINLKDACIFSGYIKHITMIKS